MLFTFSSYRFKKGFIEFYINDHHIGGMSIWEFNQRYIDISPINFDKQEYTLYIVMRGWAVTTNVMGGLE